jgi:hypothetical protein
VSSDLDADEFIDAIYLAVYQTTIDGVERLLTTPPGRKPRADLVRLSAWFNGMGDRDRSEVMEVVRLTSDQAVYGMLSSTDGARSLGQGVELTLRCGQNVLNRDHDLHVSFRHRVDTAKT